jgi:hypothetical protein
MRVYCGKMIVGEGEEGEVCMCENAADKIEYCIVFSLNRLRAL